MKKIQVIVSVLLLALVVLPVGAMAAPADEIYASLKSPTCTTDTLDKCQGEVAQQIREEIRQKLAAGESKEAIINYYVAQYGEGILAVPQKQGFDLMAWLLPVIALIGGTGVLYLGISKWSKNKQNNPAGAKRQPIDAVDQKRLDDEINKYL